ncbi:MAG: serine hydrolase [Oscillospiraceae bacterium]|nr:serine hydrolase [Oscillospiraceae bacterium]
MAKRQQQHSGKIKPGDILFGCILTAILGAGLYAAGKPVLNHMQEKNTQQTAAEEGTALITTTVNETTTATTTTTTTTARFPSAASRTTETVTISDSELVIARNACLIQVSPEGNTRIAEKDADTAIYPASLTKLMTLVTYLELMGEPAEDEAIEMRAEVVAEQQARLAYVAGFTAGESCRIQDLLYAMMLPSGADAAVMLAVHACGSEAAFVEEMNALAKEMGLQQSIFFNCTGLNDERHFSSVQDMAIVLEYAIRNPYAKKILSTRKYTTYPTNVHPEGIELISTTLSRIVGNELENLSDPLHIQGGKTGYTDPAGQCLATWAESADGNTYICVIAGSTPLQPLDAVGDTLTLYQLTDMPLSDITKITVDAENLPDYVHY